MQSTRMRAVPARIFPNVARYVSSSPTVKGTAARESWASLICGANVTAEAASVMAIVGLVRLCRIVVPPSKSQASNRLSIKRGIRGRTGSTCVSDEGTRFRHWPGAPLASAGECRRLVELTDLALALANDVEELLHERERLFLRISAKERESTDDLLRFRERAVLHGELARILPHAETQRTRQTALGADEVAGLRELLDQRAHPRHVLGGGRGAGLGGLVDGQVSHGVTSFLISCYGADPQRVAARCQLALLSRRTTGGRIDICFYGFIGEFRGASRSPRARATFQGDSPP